MRFFKSKGSSRKDSTDSSTSWESIKPGRNRLRRGTAPVNALPENVKIRPSLPTIPSQEIPTRNKLTKKPSNNYPIVDISRVYERDKQTGEQKVDHTDLLHSLINDEHTEVKDLYGQPRLKDGVPAIEGSTFTERLPEKLWDQIYGSLELADLISLSFTCKAFRDRLQSKAESLKLPENREELIKFLRYLDKSLPNHLLCYSCLIYHKRLNPGQEILRPTNIANPIFECPQVSNVNKRVTKVRLTSGKTLPFTFAQLIHRGHKISPIHGIPIDTLSKRYRDTNVQNTSWSHQMRLCMVKDHLLLRITSTTFAGAGLPPAGLRNLLYNPSEEFHPYFSTCPHWRDGELMPLVKCALSHIPKPLEGSGIQRAGREVRQRFITHQNPIVTLCGDCRPMRRCPECPTEYLIEVKMAEDKREVDPTKIFKQALVVTRWSDLGDGTTPWNEEWAACVGENTDYDSIALIGKRAIAGVFESQFTAETIPGQRILNLNTKGVKKGEEGHDWY